MDSFLVFLLGIFAVILVALNRFFIWWQRKSFEKLKDQRYRKCCDPCTPCTCEEGNRECDDVDVCAKKS